MSKFESAELILKLYDLRREPKMREARNWFFGFNPTTIEEFERTMMDPEVGAYLRMVLSYWDMAAALVNHGAIDADMFKDTAGEYIGVYAKIQPLVADLRERWEMPDAYAHLEKVIMDLPNGAERVKKTQDWFKQIAEMRSSEASA